MNTCTQLEGNSLDLINYVKQQVDELYERAQIFGLSLETLELTRRFNHAVSSVENLGQMESFSLEKLLILARHLERNLVEELK